jgi:hypothetical protein
VHGSGAACGGGSAKIRGDRAPGRRAARTPHADRNLGISVRTRPRRVRHEEPPAEGELRQHHESLARRRGTDCARRRSAYPHACVRSHLSSTNCGGLHERLLDELRPGQGHEGTETVSTDGKRVGRARRARAHEERPFSPERLASTNGALQVDSPEAFRHARLGAGILRRKAVDPVTGRAVHKDLERLAPDAPGAPALRGPMRRSAVSLRARPRYPRSTR